MTPGAPASGGSPASGGAPFLRLALPAYLLLLLLLAALGATNQGLYRSQLRLMDQKETLGEQLAETRLRAAKVNGPIAVGHWAAANAMVPVPEGSDTVLVAPEPVTLPDLPRPSLEIRTVWR